MGDARHLTIMRHSATRKTGERLYSAEEITLDSAQEITLAKWLSAPAFHRWCARSASMTSGLRFRT
jgi:hypothetical protein